MTSLDSTTDRWLRWIADGLDAEGAEQRHHTTSLLLPFRDQVLNEAELSATSTVLDVGAGDGLLGIGALQRLGPHGRVVFTGISPQVIDVLRTTVTGIGEADRCEFAVSSVTTLDGLADRSVDVAVLRSMLIYVDDRDAALLSLARVLRPGGRLALWEPVVSLVNAGNTDSPGDFFGWHLPEVPDLASVVARESPRRDAHHPMHTLTVPGLLGAAEKTGFGACVTATATANLVPCGPGDDSSVHYLLHAEPDRDVPPVAETALRVLGAEGAQLFLTALETAVRRGRGTMRRSGTVLLAATKPAASTTPV